MSDTGYTRRARITGAGGVVRMPEPSGNMGGLSQAFAGLAQTINAGIAQEGQKQEQRDVFAAEEEARTLPLRDAAGNYQLPEQRDPMTRAGRASNAGIAKRMADDMANRANEAAIGLRAQAPNDPTKFQELWGGRTEGVLAAVPPWLRPEATAVLDRLGSEHARGVATEALGTERRNQAASWGMRREGLERDLQGLAAAGDTGSPAFQAAERAYSAHLNDGVRTQQIGADAAALVRENVAEQTRGAATVRASQDAVRSGRSREEVLREFDTSMDAQRLPLAQRERLRNVVQAGLAEQEAARREQRTEATIAAEDWQTRIVGGVPVDPAEAVGLAAALDRSGAPRQAARVRDIAAVQRDAQVYRTLPTADLALKAQEAAARVLRPDATNRDVQLSDLTGRMLAQRRERMAADPLATGAATHRATVGALAPLDTSTPEGLTAGLQLRERQAQQISAREGQRIPALTAGEAVQMRTLLNEGTTDQQQAMLTGFATGLQPNTMARTLNLLVEGQDNAPRLQGFVVAAANATARPALAREILQGMEVRRQLNPGALSGGEGRDFVTAALSPVIGSRPDTMRQVTEGVLALYAKRHVSADGAAADVRRIDTAKLQPLIDELFPTLTYATNWIGGGGQRIPLPRPGMTQTQFDEHMAAMPPEALAGARSSDNRAFTPAMMRGARLVPVGEGTFQIHYNGFNVIGPDGGNFRIDLRGDWPAPQPGTAERRARTVTEFQREFMPAAELVAARLGVPASTVLAHWSLETHNGRAFVGRNNLGNMTALAEQDATEGGDRDAQGNPIRQRFRNFASTSEFADAYASWVERRAPDARNQANPHDYAAALARGNYATDPAFTDNLAAHARRFGRN